ncbi:DNA methylase [Lusitaniella coriacea LEGE 07157]|uniref:Methyltransferase n=1 Tax=Lusitaniella coriacea LEGE 07157 TaxID=945747 RepID=A0A8J7JC87_9CYAN|nr:DNA methyltransferase [Lusitaniella coriacea]MBE9117270.1 DNA methylase [Lusitaniella coriacea LEGE 07157]
MTDIKQNRHQLERENVLPFVNQILHGDCIEVMRQIPSRSVHLVVTDPPYGVRYTSSDGRSIIGDNTFDWLYPAFKESYRLLKNNSLCFSFYGWQRADTFLYRWRKVGFRPVSHFSFTKRYSSKKGFVSAHHENAYLLAKGEPEKPSQPPLDVQPWRYTGNRLHPTQKPVESLKAIIAAYSQPGDVVLDPFAGSGSTAVAARELGRLYIGIEKDPSYARIAQDRLAQLSQVA